MHIGDTVNPNCFFSQKCSYEDQYSTGSCTRGNNNIRFFPYHDSCRLKKYNNEFIAICPAEITNFMKHVSIYR